MEYLDEPSSVHSYFADCEPWTSSGSWSREGFGPNYLRFEEEVDERGPRGSARSGYRVQRTSSFQRSERIAEVQGFFCRMLRLVIVALALTCVPAPCELHGRSKSETPSNRAALCPVGRRQVLVGCWLFGIRAVPQPHSRTRAIPDTYESGRKHLWQWRF